MLKKIQIILFLIIVSNCLQGQTTKSNYALLWEISGNNLSNPSYLFGSMHVQDARAFEFCDSLFLKMQSCEAFATEIHLDTLIQKTRLINRDSLPVAPASAGKGGHEGWGIASPISRVGDMPTFLDAYLTNIARQHEKKLFGLEKWETQYASEKNNWMTGYEASDYIPGKDPVYEEMIAAYQNGDLAEIEKITTRYALAEDTGHIRRNHTMLKSMEKIMQQNTLFSVVGAAHLPGKQGLLQLLQQKGYTLRPVTATFTEMGSVTVSKTDVTNWYRNENIREGFSFETPSKALVISSDNPLNYSFIYPDMYTGVHYYFFLNQGTASQYKNLTAFYQDHITSFTEKMNAKILSSKEIKNNKAEGQEYLLQNKNIESEYLRVRLFQYQNKAYMVMAGAIKSQLVSDDVNHFFKSVQFLETQKKWKTFQNTSGAFSSQLFSQPKYKYQEVPFAEGLSYPMHLFVSTDSTNSLCMLRYNNLPNAMVSLDDASSFEEIEASVTQRFEGAVSTSRPIELQGYPGREITVSSPNYPFQIKSRVYMRGNRTYMLLYQYVVEPEQNPFLENFRFDPFQPVQLKEHTMKEAGFSIQMPAGLYIMRDSASYAYNAEIKQVQSYAATDEATGSVFVTECTFFNDDSKPDPSSFLDIYQHNFVEETDELLSNKAIEIKDGNETIPGKELVIRSSKTNVLVKTRFFIKDQTLYTLSAYIAQELAEDKQVARFFDSFRINTSNIQPTNLGK